MARTIESDRRRADPEDWPSVDRAAWQAALAPGDPFAPGGRAAHWRAHTRRTVSRGYGCVLHVIVGTNSRRWWAPIPDDRGRVFQVIVGAHSA